MGGNTPTKPSKIVDQVTPTSRPHYPAPAEDAEKASGGGLWQCTTAAAVIRMRNNDESRSVPATYVDDGAPNMTATSTSAATTQTPTSTTTTATSISTSTSDLTSATNQLPQVAVAEPSSEDTHLSSAESELSYPSSGDESADPTRSMERKWSQVGASLRFVGDYFDRNNSMARRLNQQEQLLPNGQRLNGMRVDVEEQQQQGHGDRRA